MKETPPTILVAEDDAEIRFSIVSALEREGYRVMATASGEEALELLAREPCDLVLLDVLLPDLSGLDVCRLMRRQSAVPIIMVTARDAEPDVVAGLEMGADDYVTKPFSLSVLLARVRANLRRTQRVPEAKKLQVGSLTLDPASCTVTAKERVLELSPRLFGLLWQLARHQGEVCRRDHLLDEVWGYEFIGETRTLDVHVHWLREKLRERAPDLEIRTVRGVGYRLVVGK